MRNNNPQSSDELAQEEEIKRIEEAEENYMLAQEQNGADT